MMNKLTVKQELNRLQDLIKKREEAEDVKMELTHLIKQERYKIKLEKDKERRIQKKEDPTLVDKLKEEITWLKADRAIHRQALCVFLDYFGLSKKRISEILGVEGTYPRSHVANPCRPLSRLINNREERDMIWAEIRKKDD